MKIRSILFWLIALALTWRAEAQPADVGNVNAQKFINYDQTGFTAPTLDPNNPYQFSASINPGTTTGVLLAYSTLTPPSGSTGTVLFQANSNGLNFQADFQTQAALDAGFADGIYNLTIQTSTPNTYPLQLSLSGDNYPAIPQLTSVSNATWVNGHLQVTNITQPIVFTWTPAFTSDTGSIFFQINNTSIGQSLTADGTQTTLTVPGNTLANNTAYQGSLQFSNFNSADNPLNINGGAQYGTQVNFDIQTGTPAVAPTTLNVVLKSHVLFQTSNGTPVNGSGDNDNYDAAPYNLEIQNAAAGSVTGPNGGLTLSFSTGDNGNNAPYQYASGAVANQAALDSTYPDGNYTLIDGHVAALTGDSYPNVPQVTLVNGVAPTWNAQGELVLNPTTANTITFTAFSIAAGTFATKGHEDVQFQSNDGTVNIKQKSGISESSTVTFNTFTILANAMTAEHTYVGEINYTSIPSVTIPSANIYDGAGYQTQTFFTAVASSPGTLTQTINFPALGTQQVVGTNITLVATASSGLPVTFNVLSGPASLSGNVLTFNGTGTVTVQALQAGNGTYAAAPTASQTFTVNTTSTGGIAQTITFNTIADPENSATPIVLTATASSGLPVTFSVASGPATVIGNVLTFTGTGSVTVNADQAGNGTYASATTASQTFSVNAPQDVGNIDIQKQIQYDQSSASAPTLDPNQPYQFSSNVNSGSTGTLLSTSTLTPPGSGTGGALHYRAGGTNGLYFQEDFTAKAAMDAAFTTGAYNLTLQTTTPSTYATSLTLGSDNYSPVIPQITSVTNATWSGGHLIVTNPALPVVFTWPAFNSAVGNIFFQINGNNSGTSIASQSFQADGTHTTFTLPADSLTNNAYYQGNLSFGNFTNSGGLPGDIGSVGFQNQLNFTIQVGTPVSTTATRYVIYKSNVLAQTSNSAPVNGSGANNNGNSDAAPYSLQINSPVAGSTTGPGSTNYTLNWNAGGGNNSGGEYDYSSGAVASFSALNSTYPDGGYTLADGHVVALTGDAFANAPQITLVNGAAPIWNALGQLVLDPTVTNTIAWTAFSGGTFTTNGHESVNFSSNSGNNVDIDQESGVTETSPTAFNTLTIPANSMTLNSTYGGNISYFLASTANFNSGTQTYDIAGYQIENAFEVVAQSLPGAFTPTFTSPTTVGLVSNGYIATGATLTVTLAFAPTTATTLTVVNNTSSSPIVGTFTNVPEGGTISASFGGTAYIFTATYKGGDGNDITLTYTPPIPPSSLTILHSFNDGTTANDGNQPGAGLIQGSDGNFYGTTQEGGSTGNGSIFKITPQGQVTILHSFGDGSVSNDGASPFDKLCLGSDGNFYGTTTFGGSANAGTVFKITPAGQVTILHSFGDGSVTNDGSSPQACLIQGSDGNFYGTTFTGGSANAGTVFKITPTGQVAILHNFGDGSVTNDGSNPIFNVLQAADGNFYGTASHGSSANGGCIFKITARGQVAILHSFGDGSVMNDGSDPFSGLIQAADSSFYGLTKLGGSTGQGCAFKITPGGQLTILHSFGDGSVLNDGTNPASDSLTLGKDGNFYGATTTGGSAGVGSLFQMSPQGQVTLLHSFGDGSVILDGNETGNANGLIQASDGNFYGTTPAGGSASDGTIFKFNAGLPILTSSTAAAGTIGLPFSYQTTAANMPTSYSATNLPAGLAINTATGLIAGTPTATGINFAVLTLSNAKGPASAPLTITIGTLPKPVVTSILSSYGTAGTLFNYTITASNNPTSFSATGLPGWLSINTSSGLLSGTPPSNGTFNITISASNSSGAGSSVTLVIQAFNDTPLAGEEYNVIHRFNDGSVSNDGQNPSAIFQGFDGTYYGIAAGGGSAGKGAIFNLTVQGTTTVFDSLGTGNGDAFASAPKGLLQAADGNFYGVTSSGGAAGFGAVFKVSPAGVTTILHSFGDGTVANDGNNPTAAGLIQATDGNFYGTTQAGGSKGFGVVYEITPLGQVTVLHNFGDGSVTNDGASPLAGLLQGADGNFYGTTPSGGSHGSGTIFKIKSLGVLTILHSFQDGSVTNDGANPLGALIQIPGGNFYGTTQNGGSNGTGAVFQMTTGNVVTILHSFGTVTHDGANPVASLIQGDDGNFYGVTYQGGSANEGTIFELTPGGTETLVHQFGDGTVTNDGSFPSAALFQDAVGNFYGTTGGGGSGYGTVFSIVNSQSTSHAPVYTGATTLASPALAPFSFTPKATFGISTGIVNDALVHPSFVPQAITESYSSATNWTLTGTLPQLLSFDPTSGTITGTPIQAGTFTVTVTPVDLSGPGTPEVVTFYIDVPPTITSATTAGGSVGTLFTYQITGTATPVSFGATGLPSWLSVNTSTGVISGTPPGSGTFDFSPTASNVAGTGTQAVVLTVGAGASSAPSLTSATTASATVGTAFTYQIAATHTPTSFSALSLPTGLVFTAATGVISGAPTSAGTYSVPISATNGSGSSSAVLALTVSPITPPVITSCSSITGTPSNAISYQITGTNAPTSFNATGLPSGLSIDTGTGIITGTPSGVGTSTVTLTATNSIGTGTATLALAVAPPSTTLPAVTSATSTAATALLSFNYQIAATNNPTSYDATGLPPGLAIDTSSGIITGTPTASGTFDVTLYATSNTLGTGTAELTLTIASPTFTQWASLYTNAGIPTATPENDGVPNLLKYLYDINPNQSMSATDRAALPAFGTATIEGTDYLTITYRQYSLETGVMVTLETSLDLVNWTPVTMSQNLLVRQIGTDSTTPTNDPIMQYGVPITGSAKQFLRLNVTSP